MINVTISKVNEPIIKAIDPQVEFKEESNNQSSFTISDFGFKNLYASVKEKSYNPFTIMQWETVQRKQKDNFKKTLQF